MRPQVLRLLIPVVYACLRAANLDQSQRRTQVSLFIQKAGSEFPNLSSATSAWRLFVDRRLTFIRGRAVRDRAQDLETFSTPSLRLSIVGNCEAIGTMGDDGSND
jgi:hypothetical protein